MQNGLVLVSQTRSLIAEGRPFEEALREASIGRVRPKLMTAGTAIPNDAVVRGSTVSTAATRSTCAS